MVDTAAFEFYFQKADLDRDGKISGTEAIQFFKGTNLPQPILAKIWHAADNGQTGNLSREEFYNALKLVTVAQSGRELTPEIIKAALVGPASLKIPAPKVQLPGAQPQPTPRGSFSTQQPVASQPQVHQQQQQPQTPQLQQQQRQPQQLQATFSSMPPQGTFQQMPRMPYNSVPIPQQVSGTSQAPIPRYQPQMPVQGSQQPASSWPRPMPPNVQGQLFTSVPSRPITQNLPIPVAPQSSSGFLTPRTSSTGASPGLDTSFGSGSFSASKTVTPQTKSFDSALVPVSTPTPSPPPVTGKELQPVGSQAPAAAPGVASTPMTGQQRPSTPVITAGAAWPKMTQSDVQRYSRIFVDVDTDKDGKITGGQARDLFLSWRLPREVLKQIWDLSDQDGDSMLSFREFCTALYMMERFREGRPLPSVLPTGFHFVNDTASQSVAAVRLAEAQAAIAQHNAGYNLPSWQQSPMLQPVGPGMQPRLTPAQVQGGRNVNRPKASQVADVEGKDKEEKVLDSKEKLEFYRTKLQELVLFKRKCDNRLAEITDRAAAEKREEEAMAKKYEEKYKQAAEVNSRLVSEEAAARELQARRMELQNAIAEIDRGGNPNVLLQTRADRISNDLEELEKALIQRGQHFGFHVKGSPVVALPFGWQPGLQENAAEWDENWDKFDDDGITAVQDVMDGPATVQPPAFGWDDESIFADEPDSSLQQPDKLEDGSEVPTPAESPRAESENSAVNSPKQDLWSPKSPAAKSTLSASASLRSSADFHESDSYSQHPSFASSDGFDQGPSFDSGGDHVEDRSWASAFNDHDNVRASWGLQSDYTPDQSLDFSSLRINTGPTTSTEHHSWNDSSTDFFSGSSVPSTPLFKDESPVAGGSANRFFGDESRQNSFASTQGRSSAVFDETDPFGDTGPFGTKASSRWSTF